MKKYILLFLATIILPININALELEKSYTNTISNKCYSSIERIYESYDITGNIDGHIICDGYFNECIKYDFNNNQVWRQNVSANEMAINVIYPGNDQNISVNGAKDAMLIKYSTDNNVEWTKTLSGNKEDSFEIVIRSFDNTKNHDGYIVIGTTSSTDIASIKPGTIMIKYDLQGNVVWIKNIDNYNNLLLLDSTLTEVAAVRQTGYNDVEILNHNNNLIGTINTKDVNINDVFFSKDKINKVDGIIIVGSTDTYYAFNTVERRYTDVFETPVKPLTTSAEKNAVIIKYDLKGNKLWQESINSASSAGFYAGTVLESPEGTIEGYLALGGEKNNNLSNSIIAMYDLDGNKLWSDKYSPYTNNAYSDIVKNYDENGSFNGYAVVAFNTEENSNCNQSTSIVKYTFKEYSIIKTENNEGTINVDDKAIAGTTVNINVNPNEGYLLKKIIIKDKNGKKIKITDNSFIMPEEEVKIEASFARIANQKTIAAWYAVLGVVLLIAIATHIITKQNDLN